MEKESLDKGPQQCKPNKTFTTMDTVDLRKPFASIQESVLGCVVGTSISRQTFLAVFTVVSPLLAILVLVDLLLAVFLCIKNICCLSGWMVASSILMVGKMCFYGFFFVKHSESMTHFRPPIFVYWVVDIIFVVFHLHCLHYLVNHFQELKGVIDDQPQQGHQQGQQVQQQQQQLLVITNPTQPLPGEPPPPYATSDPHPERDDNPAYNPFLSQQADAKF